VRCTLPGKWRLSRGGQTHPIAVGDRVRVCLGAAGEGTIGAIEPRGPGKLARRAAGGRAVEQVVAANVDQLVVVASAAEPPLSRGLLDRLVVSGEHGALAVVVCINKLDLAACGDSRFQTPDSRFQPEIEQIVGLYRGLGYAALATSAVTGQGVEELRAALRDKTSVLAGPSGVGKSALLMAVQPGLQLRVGKLSAATGKGRHTTTAVSLLPLDFGGFVVDTPGIREFALYDLERGDLQHCFPELRERFGRCRFGDCTHLREPGCAVRDAVATGAIDPQRYESYCHIYESLPEPDPSRRRKGGGDGGR